MPKFDHIQKLQSGGTVVSSTAYPLERQPRRLELNPEDYFTKPTLPEAKLPEIDLSLLEKGDGLDIDKKAMVHNIRKAEKDLHDKLKENPYYLETMEGSSRLHELQNMVLTGPNSLKRYYEINNEAKKVLESNKAQTMFVRDDSGNVKAINKESGKFEWIPMAEWIQDVDKYELLKAGHVLTQRESNPNFVNDIHTSQALQNTLGREGVLDALTKNFDKLATDEGGGTSINFSSPKMLQEYVDQMENPHVKTDSHRKSNTNQVNSALQQFTKTLSGDLRNGLESIVMESLSSDPKFREADVEERAKMFANEMNAIILTEYGKKKFNYDVSRSSFSGGVSDSKQKVSFKPFTAALLGLTGTETVKMGDYDAKMYMVPGASTLMGTVDKSHVSTVIDRNSVTVLSGGQLSGAEARELLERAVPSEIGFGPVVKNASGEVVSNIFGDKDGKNGKVEFDKLNSAIAEINKMNIPDQQKEHERQKAMAELKKIIPQGYTVEMAAFMNVSVGSSSTLGFHDKFGGWIKNQGALKGSNDISRSINKSDYYTRSGFDKDDVKPDDIFKITIVVPLKSKSILNDIVMAENGQITEFDIKEYGTDYVNSSSDLNLTETKKNGGEITEAPRQRAFFTGGKILTFKDSWK